MPPIGETTGTATDWRWFPSYCGHAIDKRDLWQVIFHEETDDHEPLELEG
jgi:hypothetical protein